MEQVRSITAETHDLRGKPLQCEGKKPHAPASNTSHYFQEFGLQRRMSAYKRIYNGETLTGHTIHNPYGLSDLTD